MFLFLNLRYSVKRNNLRTLCGVVVYHLPLVTRTRNQVKRPKRPKRSTQNDQQRSIKTNRQNIHNDLAKTSYALLGTSGKTDFDISLFIAGTKDDLYGLFIQKGLQNKWITGEICVYFFKAVGSLPSALNVCFYLHD